MKTISKLKIASLIISLLAVAGLIFYYFVLKADILVPSTITFFFVMLLIVIFFLLDNAIKENNTKVEDTIANGFDKALTVGKVGLLTYDEDFQITWMSPSIQENELDHVGEKLLLWLPELQNLLQGNSEKEEIVINDNKYSITKNPDGNLLYFNDISETYDLKEKIKEDAYVLGILSYDNYDESSESEDDISFVNTNIKVPVIEYFKEFNIVYKTLRNNRLMLILNEKQFKQLINDHFSILEKVRKEAKKGELDITLSMAFARGSDDIEELDEAAQSLIELAQTRGGDQVVVRKIGEEAEYFGGSTEAKEKQNKVKVRVMTNTLKDLINKSSNVIIVGHQEADADCLGSALVMSNIALALNKDAYVIARSGGLEKTLKSVLEKYEDELTNKHKLVSENEAINHLDDETLVIMVDHHSLSQSNGASIIKRAKNIVIVDHHRRKADLEFEPLMIYVEAGASSAVELTCEFLQYLGKHVELLEEEANIMYLGMLIDTNRFRVRTGSRTFDVAKYLRASGADPVVCDEMLEESYELFMLKSKLENNAVLYNDEILISTLKNEKCSRSIASQAADSLVHIKNILATFIICKTEDDNTIITARSKGDINVQTIMEKLGGGGHMTAAGYQSDDLGVEEMADKLMKAIDEYYKEGEK